MCSLDHALEGTLKTTSATFLPSSSDSSVKTQYCFFMFKYCVVVLSWFFIGDSAVEEWSIFTCTALVGQICLTSFSSVE